MGAVQNNWARNFHSLPWERNTLSSGPVDRATPAAFSSSTNSSFRVGGGTALTFKLAWDGIESYVCPHAYTCFLPVPIQGGADLLSLGIYVVGWHQMYPQTSPSDWGESDHLADTCNEHQDMLVFQFTVLQNYSLWHTIYNVIKNKNLLWIPYSIFQVPNQYNKILTSLKLNEEYW